ncbi:MAG: aminopeptidase P family protein [Acidobacteria bacterium]|nr:aminopeptidase P family protein [Acidobacteriota bacterium]
MAMPTAGRVAKLRQHLQEQGLDALIVSQPSNRRYLSGFTGSAGYLLISERETLIATDFRYFEQAATQSPDFRLQPIAGPDFETWLPGLLSGLGKVGFEAAHLPYASFEQMSTVVRALPDGERPRLVATSDIVERLRAVKEPAEIEAIQAAVDLGDAAFAHLMERIEPGWTERRAAWEIERYMREHGGEAAAFETIVGAGSWGAMPHAYPRDEALGEGRPIVIDMGVRLNGYCSDLTRTIVLGEPDGEFRRIYDIVLGAQLAAIELIAAGMSGEQAHLLAERFIAEAGYGESFGHGLGHGVGLEVHEKPRLGRGSEDALVDGMVTSIEPGIYVSGWGGVRIEDLAVMENGRLRVLSRAPKSRCPE